MNCPLYKLSRYQEKLGQCSQDGEMEKIFIPLQIFSQISVGRGEEQIEGGGVEESLLLGGFILIF